MATSSNDILRILITVSVAAVLAVSGCNCGDEEPLSMSCARNEECDGEKVCANGRCTDPDLAVRLDGGARGDGGSSLDGARDSTTEEDGSLEDGPISDGGPRPDAAAGIDAAEDATALDGGGSPDAVGDGGPAPDTGPITPVQPGRYGFRRVLLPSIPASTELTQLAISPDDRTLVVSAKYDRLYVIDIASETSTITLTLPKDSNEPILVDAIAFATDGSHLLILGNALVGTQVQGRLYRAGPHGGALAEIGTRIPGVWLQSIATNTVTGERRVLGYDDIGGTYGVYLWRYDDTLRNLVQRQLDFVMAGCQDVTFARDSVLGLGLVFACGVNGGVIGSFESTGTFSYGPATGNTSHIAARPEYDYALAIGWSGMSLVRYENGVWTVSPAAPDLRSPRVWNIAFSSDGARALITGQYETTRHELVLREYRHDLYTTADVNDVSVTSFDLPPWNGLSGVVFNDVAWRSGGDCGYMVGGCSGGGCTRGYLVAFDVSNGRICP